MKLQTIVIVAILLAGCSDQTPPDGPFGTTNTAEQGKSASTAILRDVQAQSLGVAPNSQNQGELRQCDPMSADIWRAFPGFKTQVAASDIKAVATEARALLRDTYGFDMDDLGSTDPDVLSSSGRSGEYYASVNARYSESFVAASIQSPCLPRE